MTQYFDDYRFFPCASCSSSSDYRFLHQNRLSDNCKNWHVTLLEDFNTFLWVVFGILAPTQLKSIIVHFCKSNEAAKFSYQLQPKANFFKNKAILILNFGFQLCNQFCFQKLDLKIIMHHCVTHYMIYMKAVQLQGFASNIFFKEWSLSWYALKQYFTHYTKYQIDRLTSQEENWKAVWLQSWNPKIFSVGTDNFINWLILKLIGIMALYHHKSHEISNCLGWIDRPVS